MMNMKRYILAFSFLALVLMNSCSKEVLMDKEKRALEERINASTKIDVTYTVDGAATKALHFDNKAQEVVVNVNVNDSSLVWAIESDREWCQVVKENHKGPGKITLQINSNEDFDNRSQATLTFVAGMFRGFTFTVDQEGSVFLVSQPYFISPKDGNTFTVNVTVQKDEGQEPEWDITSDTWISAEKGDVVRQDEESVTRAITLECNANVEATRLGKVTLSRDGFVIKGEVYVSQFGTDYNYDGSGNIFFNKDEQARISFLAPSKTIASVAVPQYATYSIEDVDEATVRVTVDAEENFSDCSELRITETSVILTNLTSTVISIPPFAQDYVPAHGLLTPKGLCKFAAAVNAGESLADWEKDGVVTLLGNVDMSEVKDWVGIGNEEHPFSGEFDGKGFVIDNLKNTSAGFFNKCSGAVLKNIKLGAGCNIYNSKAFSDDVAIGGLVSECLSTEIISCAFNGSMEFGAKNTDDNTVFVGGVAGRADAESLIQGCKFGGNITVSSTQGGELTAKVGGVAGFNAGNTNSCECSGNINLATSATYLYAGGILSSLQPSMVVSSNTFLGKISISGSSETNALGGLYGTVSGTHNFDFATDKSVALGNFEISKFGGSSSASLFAGGMIGRIEEVHDITISGFELGANFTVDHSVNNLNAGYLCVGGAIGGCDPNADSESNPGKIVLKNITNTGVISEPCNSVATSVLMECLSGIIGYINGSAEISGCINKGGIGDSPIAAYIAKSNSKCQIVSGIVSLAEFGDLKITDCVNSGNLVSIHYNNNVYSSISGSRYNCDIQSGILGAFGYSNSHTSHTVTVSGCSASGFIQGFRGITAGIVGYAENATVSNCNVTADFSGSKMVGKNGQANNAAYKGGVAGVLYKSSLKDCTVKSNIYASSPGSESATSAGILAIVTGEKVDVINCSWYGTLTVGTPKEDSYFGGIVASGSDDLTVNDCKYGGILNGTTINVNNVEDNAIGSKEGTINGISYWDGN